MTHLFNTLIGAALYAGTLAVLLFIAVALGA